MTKLRGLTVLIPAIIFSSGGCDRSPQFLREEENYRGSAYGDDRNGGILTQRVQALGQPKKRVLVLNFWNNTPVKVDGVGTFVADELRRGLFLSQRVILPADLKANLSTEDYVQGNQIKVEQLVREGRRMGVAIIVVGRITQIAFRQKGDDVGLFRQKESIAAAHIEAKAFDVLGGREIMSLSRSGEYSNSSLVAFEGDSLESPEYRIELTQNALRDAIAGFIPEVIRATEKLNWQGKIAKVIGPKFYINAGRASGITSGDILRVTQPGEDVYDPTSGAFLGRSQGALKGTLEVSDFLGLDGAVTLIHTGGNFKEGDIVQLY
jgi:hypothetical protein